jgi:hypothetical protein
MLGDELLLEPEIPSPPLIAEQVVDLLLDGSQEG